MKPAEAAVMRAIATRERRRALEERRSAEAASRGAVAPAPSVGWSRKPDRPRKAGVAAKALAGRAEANREAWAKRHPAPAKAERRLRKERASMLQRWDHKNQGTPETHEHASRRNQGALARLCKNGEISGEQLAAAEEIAAVHERIGADVAVKTASLETRIDMTRMGDGTFFERLAQVRREMAYTRWRAEVTGPIAAVLEMIVGEPVGFTIVAKAYRIHNRKAKRLLIDALDLWPRVLSDVGRLVDREKLDAAHARLA